MIGDRILIVCTANMIRSPFVAGLLSSRLPAVGQGGLVVESAGTAARPGGTADEGATALGRTYGLALENHRSRRLGDGMLRTGDTVLCAEKAHRRVVLDLRPDLIASVFTIREFARLVDGSRRRAAGWRDLVEDAARGRLGARYAPEEEEDMVDPVGGSPTMWLEFERQATQAVSTILGAVAALPTSGEGASTPSLFVTRREYRERRALAVADGRPARRG